MKVLNESSDIRHVRALARTMDAGQIARCINQQLAHQPHGCVVCGDTEQVLNILSRAHVVRQLMEDGASLGEALRELGRRMRRLSDLDGPNRH